MSPKTEDDNNVTKQWITSLAIAVVCCAFLFLVFAIYIADLRKLNEQMSLTVVRLEALQTRQMQVIADLDKLRRPPQLTTQPADAMPSVPSNGTETGTGPSIDLPAAEPPPLAAPDENKPGDAPPPPQP